MTLVDEGRLDLDEPDITYLSDLSLGDAAEIALLLPTVQAASEAARQSACAAAPILTALQRRNQRAGEFTHTYSFGYDVADAAVVDAAIAEVLRLIEDDSACARGV
jgi:hypothetical protein